MEVVEIEALDEGFLIEDEENGEKEGGKDENMRENEWLSVKR